MALQVTHLCGMCAESVPVERVAVCVRCIGLS